MSSEYWHDSHDQGDQPFPLDQSIRQFDQFEHHLFSPAYRPSVGSPLPFNHLLNQQFNQPNEQYLPPINQQHNRYSQPDNQANNECFPFVFDPVNQFDQSYNESISATDASRSPSSGSSSDGYLERSSSGSSNSPLYQPLFQPVYQQSMVPASFNASLPSRTVQQWVDSPSLITQPAKQALPATVIQPPKSKQQRKTASQSSPPPVAVATIIDADSSLTKTLRHREIDRRRRERENKVLARLKALIDVPAEEETQSNNLAICHTGDTKQTKSAAKTMDRVSLLEAACNHIEALHRQASSYESIYRINQSIHQSLNQSAISRSISSQVTQRPMYYIAFACDTGQQIDISTIHHDTARLTSSTEQSMHWMLVAAHLEIAYANYRINKRTPQFSLALPPPRPDGHEFIASRRDPLLSDLMFQCWRLLLNALERANNPYEPALHSVKISLGGKSYNPSPVDTDCTVWLAKARYHGKPNSENSFTNGRVFVLGSYPPDFTVEEECLDL